MSWKTTSKANIKDENGSRTVKTSQKNEDNSVTKGDRYTHTEDNKHVHESYTLDKTSGAYKEYRGGENAHDRSYNRK